MAKKREPVDELLDALVWMRRKARKHEAVDDLVDALVKMRRRARKKLAKRQGKHEGIKQRKGIKKDKGTKKRTESRKNANRPELGSGNDVDGRGAGGEIPDVL